MVASGRELLRDRGVKHFEVLMFYEEWYDSVDIRL